MTNELFVTASQLASDFDIFLDTIPLHYLQFAWGVIGTLTYFACVKTGIFFKSEDNNSIFKQHTDLRSLIYMLAFTVVGGLLPVILGITTPLGAFGAGLTFRATLKVLFNGKNF